MGKANSPDIRFTCTCGSALEMPAESAGTTMECPWCACSINVPVPDGATPAVKDEPKAPEEWARCPSCASFCAGASCGVCEVPTERAEAYRIPSRLADLDLIPAEASDWILRKSAWLIRRMGLPSFGDRKAILPTKDWFPDALPTRQEQLDALLKRLQRYAGLEGLDVRIAV